VACLSNSVIYIISASSLWSSSFNFDIINEYTEGDRLISSCISTVLVIDKKEFVGHGLEIDAKNSKLFGWAMLDIKVVVLLYLVNFGAHG